MTSGFSGNLALFNVEYCHVHCDCVEPNKFLLLLLLSLSVIRGVIYAALLYLLDA